MKYIWIGVLFMIPMVLSAQEGGLKELTLETAVMQQNRALRPQGLMRFSWIPNTVNYVYLEDNYQSLMKASAKNTVAKKILTVQEVNQACGSELYNLYGMDWKNESEVWFSDGSKFYGYNMVTKKGELLHDIGQGENPTYNLNSGYLAFTAGNDIYLSKTGDKSVPTTRSIRITNNMGTQIVSGQAIARSEFGISGGLFWSPNGKLLAYYQKDESNVHDYPLLDISKTPGELKSIKYPMAGQGTEKASVGIYNTESGKTVTFATRHGAENYITNLAWTKDNNYVVVAEVNRAQDHMWLLVYDAATGKFVRTLFEEQNDAWIEPEHAPYFLHDNSNDFVWVSERSGFANLYHYDFNGNLVKQLTNHNFVVKEINGFKNGRLYYYATGENPTETQVYSVDLNGASQKLTQSPGTHHVDISPDGKYFHNQFSSLTIPNRQLLINAKGKIESTLIDAPNKLADYKIGELSVGSVVANDGTSLVTRLIKPSDFDPSKKYPVLVYVYGGPHAQMITNSWLGGASLWMHWMAEQGYLVFTLDNRGSAHRGFAFESQIHRRLGTIELEDQMSGVNYLKSLPYVDANRLAVHGWSFGGFMTGTMMLRAPDVFQVGVAGGPVTDWKYYEIMYGERYMDTPEENPKGYEQASLLTHAGNLKGDLLLIHGTVDDVVVMQHNYALVQRFVELGIQMDFFPYPMHKHNVFGKDRVHLMEKILTYVLENNQ